MADLSMKNYLIGSRFFFTFFAHLCMSLHHYACFPHISAMPLYFNEICVTIYLMYPLQVKQFTNYIKLLCMLTKEHTLHSRIKLASVTE